MSDSNISAQIDALVAAGPTVTPGPARDTIGHLSVTIDRDTKQVTSTEVVAAPKHTSTYTAPGHDLSADVGSIDAEITRVSSDLSEVARRDVDGNAVMKYSGKDRSDLQRQLETLKTARQFQVESNARVQQARDAEAAAKAQSERELAERHSYTQGNQTKAALLDKALEEAAAKEAADRILKGRRGA